MSVTIRSPFSSEVFPSFDYSLSPPPTPIAKRARHFFPNNAATLTPLFFSKSQSLLDSTSSHQSADGDKEAFRELERKHLAMLASRPAPSLQLKPRSTLSDATHDSLHSNDISKSFKLDDMPELPFAVPPKNKSFKPINSSEMPDIPSLSLSTSSPKKLSKSDPGMGKNPSHPTTAMQHAKLPAFQRSGVHRRTVRKRNSLVARSA